MNTTITKKSDITQNWHLFDAKDYTLGRLATIVSAKLIGKDKIYYTGNLIVGDKIVIINTDKIKVTGNKVLDKKYYRHSGYAGGFKERNLGYYMEKDSTFVIKNAIKGMLPKNRLRDRMMANLHVYKDGNHKQEAQVKNNSEK